MQNKTISSTIFLAAMVVAFATRELPPRQNEPPKGISVVPPSSSVRGRFLGTWELVSADLRYTDGTRQPYPELGPRGKGYLMYMADGHMCAHLMNPDRAAWKNGSHPTDAEKISAFDGFAAYCGKFEVDEAKNIMVHLPDVAWNPGFVGSRQPRPYTFSDSGNLLTFSDKETDQPGIESYSITWRKLGVDKKD